MVVNYCVSILEEQSSFSTTLENSATVWHSEDVLVCLGLGQEEATLKPTKVDILILQVLYHKFPLLVKNCKFAGRQPGGISPNRGLNPGLQIGSTFQNSVELVAVMEAFYARCHKYSMLGGIVVQRGHYRLLHPHQLQQELFFAKLCMQVADLRDIGP